MSKSVLVPIPDTLPVSEYCQASYLLPHIGFAAGLLVSICAIHNGYFSIPRPSYKLFCAKFV